METRAARVVGTEPLAPHDMRAGIFVSFNAASKKIGKRSLMVPVSRSLASELKSLGCLSVQVGSEPVFNLQQYFGADQDPLQHFPAARTLLRRGARVREVILDKIDPAFRNQLDTYLQSWLLNRSTVPWSFLNQVDPWKFSHHKKLFVLEYKGVVQAFLSTTPIYSKNSIFFADYIRGPHAKAGAIELLFVEAMRSLKTQGHTEVRMGLCPLAGLTNSLAPLSLADRFQNRVLRLVFRTCKFPMNFKSIYDFKLKLKPTHWEPLYLVSFEWNRFHALLDLTAVHFPEGIAGALKGYWKKKLSDIIHPRAKAWISEKSGGVKLSSISYTISFSTVFLFLHLGRSFHPQIETFYKTNGFSAGSPHWLGWFLGPLFHNNHYHFLGDVSSFLIIGAAMEIVMGKRFFLFITAIGLWLSNPITWATLSLTLQTWAPLEYSRMLAEVDYGSSNAIYAGVGALSALILYPRTLLFPFILNGLLLCLARNSWLSIHHLVGLASGYIAALVFLRSSNSDLVLKSD